MALNPRRAKETTRPDIFSPDAFFFKCGICGDVVQMIRKSPGENAPECCAEKMGQLLPVSAAAVDWLNPDYSIIGGYDDNCIKVTWNNHSKDLHVAWVSIRTYSGFQIKFIPGNKTESLTFALADTDAYVYCDEDPCLECTFLCKRGFIIYLITSDSNLVMLPMDRMRARW